MPWAAQSVITDGTRPVTVVEGGTAQEIPVPSPVGSADTTGAGDAFAAGLIDGLVRGEDTAAAVRRGMAGAARHLAGQTSISASVSS